MFTGKAFSSPNNKIFFFPHTNSREVVREKASVESTLALITWICVLWFINQPHEKNDNDRKKGVRLLAAQDNDKSS